MHTLLALHDEVQLHVVPIRSRITYQEVVLAVTALVSDSVCEFCSYTPTPDKSVECGLLTVLHCMPSNDVT